MMVTKCSECSVKVFMQCAFDNNFKGLHGGDWDKIYTEYIDLSGIGSTIEYDILFNIQNIQCRILHIEQIISLHRKCFIALGEPFFPAINDLAKYGYPLRWDEKQPMKFVKDLEMIDIRERKSIAELDKHFKDLRTLQQKGPASVPVKSAKIQFVRTLNGLGKFGFKIDKDTTDMEALALMMNDYYEAVKDQARERDKPNL